MGAAYYYSSRSSAGPSGTEAESDFLELYTMDGGEAEQSTDTSSLELTDFDNQEVGGNIVIGGSPCPVAPQITSDSSCTCGGNTPVKVEMDISIVGARYACTEGGSLFDNMYKQVN